MKKYRFFKKQYDWSSPFIINEVNQFTLKVHPRLRKQRLQDEMAGLSRGERILLTKIMNEPKFVNVRCKADLS